MRKIILSSIAAVLLFSSYIMSYKLTSTKGPEPKKAEAVLTFSSYDKYTVKEYNDKIAIFKENCDDPVKSLDVYVFTLPESDRKMLKNGFEIIEDEIESVIEDYTG